MGDADVGKRPMPPQRWCGGNFAGTAMAVGPVNLVALLARHVDDFRSLGFLPGLGDQYAIAAGLPYARSAARSR